MGKFREIVENAKNNVATARGQPITIQEEALMRIMINDPTCRNAFQGKNAFRNRKVFNLAYRPELTNDDPVYFYRLKDTILFTPHDSSTASNVAITHQEKEAQKKEAQKKGAEGFFSVEDEILSSNTNLNSEATPQNVDNEAEPTRDESNLKKLKSMGAVYAPIKHNWETNACWVLGIIQSNRPVMPRSMPRSETLKRMTPGVPENYSAFAKEIACLDAAGYRCEIVDNQIQFVPPERPNNVLFRNLVNLSEDSIRQSFYAFRDTFLQYAAPGAMQHTNQALETLFNPPLTPQTINRSFERLEEDILTDIADEMSEILEHKSEKNIEHMMKHFPSLKACDDQEYLCHMTKITTIHFFHQLGEKILREMSPDNPNTEGINHPFIKSLEKAAITMLDQNVHKIVCNRGILDPEFCKSIKSVISKQLMKKPGNTLVTNNHI